MTISERSVTLVISTKNRLLELERALRSVLLQTVIPEIIVIDDGSTDATSDFVSKEFPSVVLVQHAESRGYISRRNEGAQIANGEIIISIDDDAVFSEVSIISDCLKMFEHGRIGAIAIPYIDVNRDAVVRQLAPDDDVWITNSFIGTAHALRRDVFLRLGGYREALVHQGEESDYCIRMLEAGWVVALGRGAPIHHHESLRRDFARMDYYGARNAVLFVLENVPLPALGWRLLATIVGVVTWTFKVRRLGTRLRGMAAGFQAVMITGRHPVSRHTHRLFRALGTSGPKRLADIRFLLSSQQKNG